MTDSSISIDANVLVYAHALGDRRRPRALDIVTRMAEWGVVLCGQTMGEFINVVSRKLGVSREATLASADRYRAMARMVYAGEDEFELADNAFRTHGLQYFDALMWATLRNAGVTHLLSEDLQDGRTLGGVTFVNPFNPTNAELVDRLLPPVT